MESEGLRLHQLTEQTREEGNAEEAFALADQAYAAYEIEGNKAGMAEVLSSKSIALRHLWQQTDDRDYLVQARDTQVRAVEIARESGDETALAIPLFQLANVQEALGDLSEAVVNYRDAFDQIIHNPPEAHDRSAVKADFKGHLTTCEYKAGDKEALPRAEAALDELEQADEPDMYAKDVWVSGGYMRIAEMLRDDNPAKARDALEKAKEIIDANPELTKRREQWEKLADTFTE